jgi:membrane-associated phospholipid phosphatase
VTRLRTSIPSFEDHPYFWILPFLVLTLLWPLTDPTTNRTLFQAFNGFALILPDGFWSSVTVLGDTLVALCLLLPFLRRRPDLVVAALLASLPATLISHGLKTGLDFARPFAVLGNSVHVIGPHLIAGSFPSGHTTTAFVLASVLAGGLRNRTQGLWLLLLALLVGMSRVGVGAHWPLDIAGGILCGWVSALIGLCLARRFIHPGNPTVSEPLRIILIACAIYLFYFYDTGYPLARPFEQALCIGVLVYHLLPGWSLASNSPDSD